MITLKTPEERLEQARRDLEELAYAVSHDISAPARHIGSFAKLALRKFDDDPEAARKHMEVVEAGAQQLHKMLEVLLFYSRVGRLEQAFERVHVGDLVDAAVIEHAESVDAQNQDIRFIGGPVVTAEREQLARAIHEAVGNIAHHAGRDVRATIQVTEDESHWHIHIVDDGCGIPQRRFLDAMRLFRHIEHQGPEHVGAGLGLVQRVCRRHDGTAALRPTEAGTHLHLTISKTGGP